MVYSPEKKVNKDKPRSFISTCLIFPNTGQTLVLCLLTPWWVPNFRAYLVDFSSFNSKKMEIDITSLKRNKKLKKTSKIILTKCWVRPALESWSKYTSYCPFMLITNSGQFFKKIFYITYLKIDISHTKNYVFELWE